MRMHVHLKTFAVTWVTLVTKTYEWSWANSRPHESQWSSSSKIEFKVELDFDSKYTEKGPLFSRSATLNAREREYTEQRK